MDCYHGTKKPRVPVGPRPQNKKAMGLCPCPPMALDAHLCTGLSLQPEGGLLKKEAAEGKTKLQAGNHHQLFDYLRSSGA